jgi:hypothetical protein
VTKLLENPGFAAALILISSEDGYFSTGKHQKVSAGSARRKDGSKSLRRLAEEWRRAACGAASRPSR